MLLQSLFVALCLVGGVFMFPAEKVARKVQHKRDPQIRDSPQQGFSKKPQHPAPNFNEKPPHPPPRIEERPPPPHIEVRPPPPRFDEGPPPRFDEGPPQPRVEERPPPPRFEEGPPPPHFDEGPSHQQFMERPSHPPPQFENKPPPPPPQPYHDDYAEPRNYDFNYLIDDQYTGNFQTREETKDGTRTVGSYSLREPTGAIRIVKYIADNNGFRAIVHRMWPDGDKPNQ